MDKKTKTILCIVICMLLCVSGCKNNIVSNSADPESSIAGTEANTEINTEADAVSQDSGSRDSVLVKETTVLSQEESSVPDEEEPQPVQIVESDLKPSEGFEFESSGDGTCTITGIGTCTDKDIVIPLESPYGETVTLIGEYALYSLEDVNSITFVNYTYEIDKYAFQYGEFTEVNFIGGSPVINQSAFSSCEDLTSVSFRNCNIQADKYAFYSCGKNADVTFSDCTGVIGEYAFQYSDLLSLTINNCEFQIEKSAFSTCEDLTSIVVTDSILETEKHAFYSLGDSAKIEMTNCSLTFDDYTFQYSSLESLTITGPKVEMGESAFSTCKDLAVVNIDCDSVFLDEHAFYDCEDLKSVSICENEKTDQEIKIDDRAFQYCEKLETVHIGNGNIEIGESVFSSCADNLEIFVAGKHYTADGIKDGLD